MTKTIGTMFMHIEKKAFHWAGLFAGPAVLLLVYVPFATQGTGRSDIEMWTVFSLLMLPGSYVIATQSRAWWARVILALGYILFVLVLFLVYALSYSCTRRGGACL